MMLWSSSVFKHWVVSIFLIMYTGFVITFAFQSPIQIADATTHPNIDASTFIYNSCTWVMFKHADQMDVEHSPTCTNFH